MILLLCISALLTGTKIREIYGKYTGNTWHGGLPAAAGKEEEIWQEEIWQEEIW